MVKIEYWEDEETPDNTGWYINSYDDLESMTKQSPYDSVGPYDTKTQALRVFRDTNSAGDMLYGDNNEPSDENQSV